MCVSPELQRRGLGRALMDRLIEQITVRHTLEVCTLPPHCFTVCMFNEPVRTDEFILST